MKLSVVVPIFNNESTIKILVDRIENTLSNLKILNYELIFVNDGSFDNSLQLLKNIKKQNSKVKIINLSKNFGQAAAITAGLKNASGDLITQFDADLQDPPEIIKDMLQEFNDENIDIVICARESTKTSFLRNILSITTHKILRFSFPEYPEKGFNVWMIKKNVNNHLIKFTRGYTQLDLFKIGFGKKIIFYKREKRFCGKSSYSLINLVDNLLELISPALEKLFKILFYISGIISFISFLNLIWLFVSYFFFNHNDTQEGINAILAYIFFFSGLILLLVSILGNYIFKIINLNQKNEQYYIKEIF